MSRSRSSIVVVQQRPRRRAPVLRRVPRRCCTWRPAGRRTSSGGLAAVPRSGRSSCTTLFGHVQQRVDNWLDPFADPLGAGYQTVQALYAFARGGLLGVGLGRRAADDRRAPPDPGRPHRLPARGAGRGARAHRAARDPRAVPRRRSSAGSGSPPAPHDDFRALLAAGLALVVGVQAFIIAAGNLKLIPLTGITLPFISLRRLVAARERRRRRACCSPCPTADPSRRPCPAPAAAGCRASGGVPRERAAAARPGRRAGRSPATSSGPAWRSP